MGNNAFGERLRALRTSKALSQRALAEVAGVSPQSVNAYERGERYPVLSKAFALADALGVTVEQLAGRDPVSIDL